MNHFPMNTYLHCHVMEIIRRQLDRNLPQINECIFAKTALLDNMVEGVQMVDL